MVESSYNEARCLPTSTKKQPGTLEFVSLDLDLATDQLMAFLAEQYPAWKWKVLPIPQDVNRGRKLFIAARQAGAGAPFGVIEVVYDDGLDAAGAPRQDVWRHWAVRAMNEAGPTKTEPGIPSWRLAQSPLPGYNSPS